MGKLALRGAKTGEVIMLLSHFSASFSCGVCVGVRVWGGVGWGGGVFVCKCDKHR